MGNEGTIEKIEIPSLLTNAQVALLAGALRQYGNSADAIIRAEKYLKWLNENS